MFASAQAALGNTFSVITTISIETMVLGAGIAGLMAYGVLGGKYRLVSLVLALIIAIPLQQLFPYQNAIPAIGSEALTQVLFYAVLVIGLHFLGNRLARGQFPLSRLRRLGEALALSVAAVGLAGAVAYTQLPASELYTISGPYLAPIFSGEAQLFWWSVVAIATLILTSRSRIIA